MLLVYKFQQYCAQREMDWELYREEARLEKLVVSLHDFQNGRINEREISVNGKLYDIKSVSILGNTVELLVVNDEKEERILAKIKELRNNTNEQSSPFSHQFVKLPPLVYIFSAPNSKLIFPALEEDNFVPLCECAISRKFAPPFPPPKLV